MNKKSGAKKGTVLRILKTLVSFFPVMVPLTLACIIFNAIVASIPPIFMEKVITLIEENVADGTWSLAGPKIISYVLILVCIYVVALLSSALYNQLMAFITQGTLCKMREKMFDKMQTLKISYFDRNGHGDIMSYYTNDIDALRQMISQSFPQLIISGVTVTSLFFIMLYYCGILTAVVLLGVTVMLIVTKKVGGGSARYFVAQQKTIARTEAFIEEMMNGQKVIKVFSHEEESKKDFDRVNGELVSEATRANAYANVLGPILNNVGNIFYVLVAIIGGLLLIFNVPNISLSGRIISVGIVVPFLNMTKQFAANVNQVSHQINAIVMGLAGASRIFALVDEESEADEGYVTLVNAVEKDGELVESDKRTNIWAWRHPHADGTVSYTRLRGEVTMNGVDFEYEENKPVLRDVTLYARPGEKIAFVGATGAGKTTITNLINRFYDIADGKIRYDGININKIKKSSLRKSLGIVLQETNLFTGTVMDNIRYGKLDADDEECIAAARLAGADDFISRLPNGYNTVLKGNGANLSQGQRQLLAIARAAVADPPVMILDEATSSIDTRTEAIVQRGMDALMKGRTVFVIAHRLSTVKNSDVIMVLDHGRIIERGSHDSLIAEQGQYYRLYTGAFELE